jgi:hypothetical protein
MRRHDWAMVGLIGTCALGSIGVTAVLYLRWVDSFTHETTFYFAHPPDRTWEPAEEVEPEPSRDIPGEVRVLRFGVDSRRMISHRSHGSPLVARPVRKPFLKVDPKTGVEVPVRYRELKPGFEYSLRWTLPHTHKPSG